MNLDIDSPHVDNIIDELSQRVLKYDNNKGKHRILRTPFAKSYYIYTGIPIIIFLALLYGQPRFVKYERKQSAGLSTYHVSFSKLILWTLVLTSIIGLGIFGYSYKRRS